MKEKIKKFNNGKKEVISIYQPKYPDTAEREYLRICNNYMKIEKQILLKHIPELMLIINNGTELHMDSTSKNNGKRKKIRFSSLDNTIRRLRIVFDKINKEMDFAFGLFDLVGQLNKVANLNHKLTVSEWKKTISKTLGVDILDDYYSGEYYKTMLDKWVADNVVLIKTVPISSLGKMKDIVYTNFMEGRSTSEITKQIQQQYGMDKRHAKLIARDQTSKLNATITKSQQTDAGVRRYEWSDSRDGKVRRSHKRLNGHIFYWSSPPETDSGRRCHPGEDYQCRCCALPVFDIDEVDFPI